MNNTDMSIWDRLETGITTDSPETTREFGRELAGALPPDSWLALQGPLGAGKTTLVQGLASAWLIDVPITSPTFLYHHIHEGSRQLVHVDAYRLRHAEQIDGLLIEEFLRTPYCLVIEWPENVEDWLPKKTIRLRLIPEADDRRRIQLQSQPPG